MSKRLLKSVISSLGVFDTDTLDLDKLNVSWGSNSTIVYNDVGLMLKVSHLWPSSTLERC